MQSTEALEGYRATHASGGLAAVRQLEIGEAPTGGDLPEEDQFELLGWEAWRQGRPGWAYISLRAAQELVAEGGQIPDARRLEALSVEVLDQAFAPYATDAEVLAEVRQWAEARRAEVVDLAEPAPETVDLKHRWLFRLVQTRRSGRTLRMDALADRLDLGPRDRVVLWVTAALAPGEPLALRPLVALLQEPSAPEAQWLARFDPRQPLLSFALVHLAASPWRSLRRRRVEVDEAVLSWLEGRDTWPLALADLARPVLVAARDEDELAGAGTWIRLVRALGGERPRPVVVHCRSEEAAREAVIAWAARAGRALVELAEVPSLGATRALVREVRLRRAVLMVPARCPPSGGVDLLARAGAVPLVFLSSAPITVAALEVHLEPPERSVRSRLWNEALEDLGLPPLAPRDLDEHLGGHALFRAEIRALARRAADAAWLTGEDVYVGGLSELVESALA